MNKIGILALKIKKHLNFTSLRKKLSETFRSIEDWRQSTKVTHSIHDALMSGYAVMHFQDPSLLQFQLRMQEEQHRNNLRTLFDVESIPKESQMREIIDGVDNEHFRSIFKDFYMRLQRSKYLEQYQLFPNEYYFPIDGSQFSSSEDIHCEQCLEKEHGSNHKNYSHQVLQGGIMHPDMSEVIPFMPEQICNIDGTDKQDCEINAGKRLIKKLRDDFMRLQLIIGGDALFSKQPIIEEIIRYGMSYIFTVKPSDHKYLMEWIDAYDQLNTLEMKDTKGKIHIYEWMNDVPLNGRNDAIQVNFFRCKIMTIDKEGEEKIAYKSSWVTDRLITHDNISTLVKGARCRWKNENECFNVMKNHGYYMAHNYGHGKKNLAFNFYLLTLLAFFIHQIFELSDRHYQSCRKKFGSKRHLWEKLRAYIDIIVFETWEQLLDFAFRPKAGLLTWAHAP